MKYMGSKRTLLSQGLGDIVVSEAKKGRRFVDLFTGTGQVSWHVAESVPVPVLAVDLQRYATVLAGSIIERCAPIDPLEIIDRWLEPTQLMLSTYHSDHYLQDLSINSVDDVLKARKTCHTEPGGPIWTAYGGHYYSPHQALVLDTLLANIPQGQGSVRMICKALLILAASQCAAAPGHTAQPFQPTKTSLPFILESWRRNPIKTIERKVSEVASRYALRKGATVVEDASTVAERLERGDVVFVDPPYSAVQYSRFYHVLETIARGNCGPVSGAGRYPPRSERPQSAFSLPSLASTAMLGLLSTLARQGCVVILTFPYANASNEVEGWHLIDCAKHLYFTQVETVRSRFSTMGGNGYNREARQTSVEIIAVLNPK